MTLASTQQSTSMNKAGDNTRRMRTTSRGLEQHRQNALIDDTTSAQRLGKYPTTQQSTSMILDGSNSDALAAATAQQQIVMRQKSLMDTLMQ